MEVDSDLAGNTLLGEIGNFITPKKKIKQKAAAQSKYKNYFIWNVQVKSICPKKIIGSSKNRLKERFRQGYIKWEGASRDIIH